MGHKRVIRILLTDSRVDLSASNNEFGRILRADVCPP